MCTQQCQMMAKLVGEGIFIGLQRYLSESVTGSNLIVQWPQFNNPHTWWDIGRRGGCQGTSTLAVPANTNVNKLVFLYLCSIITIYVLVSRLWWWWSWMNQASLCLHHFALWICHFSCQEVELVSYPLESGLALRLSLTNRIWWKWCCCVDDPEPRTYRVLGHLLSPSWNSESNCAVKKSILACYRGSHWLRKRLE